jgi:hypothetical protein
MKKLIIIGCCLVLLLVACVLTWHHFRVPSDAEIRHKIMGGWATTDGTETIFDFAQDGSYTEGHLAQLGGVWQVEDRVLTLKMTKFPAGFKQPQGVVLAPFKFRIIDVDDQHIVYTENTTTNVWRRR